MAVRYFLHLIPTFITEISFVSATNGYKNKIVGKFGKDSPTIQFIFSIRGRINYTMLCSSLESIYNTRFNAKDMNTQYRFRAFVTPNCDLR